MRWMLTVVVTVGLLLLGGCGGADESDEPEPTGTSSTTPSVPPTDAAEPTEGTDPSATPTAVSDQAKAAEQALRDYLLASDAGDCAAVKKVTLDPDSVECSDVRTGKGRWSKDGTDLATTPMDVEVVDGTSATIIVTWVERGQDVWDLEYVDGAWLVLNADLVE